jgi:hypothetical protein
MTFFCQDFCVGKDLIILLSSNVICGGLSPLLYVQWEVIVRFVDIGGIVYYHCLHVLFIILQKSTDNKFENTPKRDSIISLVAKYINLTRDGIGI